jgi:hypothetical protein
MTLNWKRKRFDNFIFLFNNQSPFMSKDSCNNILTLKFSPDEVSRAIDLDSTMRVDFSDEGDFSFSNRDVKMSVGIDIPLKGETLWQMPKGLPEAISKHPGESCAIFFLGKPSMWFLIMVIPQKTFTGSSNDSKGRTIMSSKHSFLPEPIKTLNRCISTWFSLRDKYQMDAKKQMKSDNLRKAEGVASSTCSSHLIIHLRDTGNPHISPCFNQMSAQRDSLFIRELTCKGCMACNIHGMKRIKSGDPSWASEVSGSHKVCLMKVSHLFCFDIGIRLIIAMIPGLNFTSLSITGEDVSNGRDGRNFTDVSSPKLPMNNLCSNSREGRSSALMIFQFCSKRKDLFNHMLRSPSPDSLWGTALVFETFKPIFFKPFEPFGEPSFTPLNQLECFVKTISFFMKLYRFATFFVFIFILILHRLYLLPKFGRSLGDAKNGLRCYQIFKVYHVIR